MKEQQILVRRIEYLCKKQGISYYVLSYRSTVPLPTLMHILDLSTRNPGIFTLAKICNGLGITLKDFFDAEEFKDIEYELE
ncbi:MAG: XRE family transcriptional regulator [Lachnospiraceae bacterium]|nr:XRE family transcriptional regulator [Lachnospiraceae bacterium]